MGAAAAVWARVSETVEARIIEDTAAGRPTRLAPADWVSGDSPRLVLAVGQPKALEALLVELKKGPFSGHDFRKQGKELN